MKNLKLITAILLEIRAFLNRNASFSAYDVTTSLRSRVNSGEFSITDVDTLQSGAARIEHNEVKALIEEFYNEDLLPIQRSDNGHYRIYSAIKVSSSAPATQTVTTSPTTQDNEEFESDSSQCQDCSCDSESLVIGYVNRKLSKGELPTLKSVQSCLKGVPITVVDIKNICCAKGFKVSPQPGLKPSLSIIYK